MKATLLRQYPSKKNIGQTNYTYVLSGTPEENALYAESQGDFLRTHDDGRYLFFTDKFGVTEVKFSSKGEPFADTSSYDNANSLIDQLPDGILKEKTAEAMAQALLAQAGFSAKAQAVIQKFDKPASEPAKADDAEDLGTL